MIKETGRKIYEACEEKCLQKDKEKKTTCTLIKALIYENKHNM
jgi:hypothetical protein